MQSERCFKIIEKENWGYRKIKMSFMLMLKLGDTHIGDCYTSVSFLYIFENFHNLFSRNQTYKIYTGNCLKQHNFEGI